MKSIRRIRAPWKAGLVVVCRECDGYSKGLRRSIKDALEGAGLRKMVRVVESSCLDVCPKRETTVVAVTPEGSEVVLVPAGTHDPAALSPLVRRFEITSRRARLGEWEPSPERLR